MRKKILSAVLASALAVSVLAGCASTGAAPAAAPADGAATEEAAPAAGEQVTIRVALWDYSNTEYYKTMFDAFSQAHPEIAYEVVEFPADEFPTTIKTQLAGKQNFDVVFLKDLPTMSALIAGGLEGIIVGAIISLSVLLIGQGHIENRMMDINLPKPLRKVVTRSSFENRMKKISPEVKASFFESLEKEKNTEITGRLTEEISEQIEQCLTRMAEVVEIPLG